MKRLLLLIAMSVLPYHAIGATESGRPCQRLPASECLQSEPCTLALRESKTITELLSADEGSRNYSCRDSKNHCEQGLRQYREPRLKAQCEMRAGCSYSPGACYCPPISGVKCICGNGPPPSCEEVADTTVEWARQESRLAFAGQLERLVRWLLLMPIVGL